jgi:squalene-hopene/tetraprenyl-beta-curcumene cyclase
LRGTGNVTPSQTAWAVLGLIAAGRQECEATARGIRSLVESQQTDGSWPEQDFTGTGFPRVFYLKYHYYRVYFPLMALARWSETLGEKWHAVETAAPMPLRLEVPTIL